MTEPAAPPVDPYLVPPPPLQLRPFARPTAEQLGLTPEAAEEAALLFQKHVKALAYTFLSCPAVVEAFILHWMKSAKTRDGYDPERSIEELMTTLSNHRCVLSMTFHNTVDSLGNQRGKTCDFSLLVNHAGRGGDEDFDCDEDTLRQYVESTGLIDMVAFNARLNYLVLALLCYNGTESFRLEDVRVNNLACRYSNFGSDAQLQAGQDRSIFFLCLMNFIVDYLHEIVTRDRYPEEEFQTAMDVFLLADKFVRELRDRCSWITHGDDDERMLKEGLYAYKSRVHDDGRTHLFGVPVAVVNHEGCEKRTLLWLEWAWKTMAADSGAAAGIRGLREKVNNLWRAKSYLMWRDYYSFFHKWDRQVLMPNLRALATTASSASQ